MRPAPGRATYPRSLSRCVITARVRLPATGRGCASAFTWQRPAPGKESPAELEIREACVLTVAAEAPAMAPCAATALRAQGVTVDVRATGRGREAKASQQDTNRRHAGAARRPTRPEQGLREPDGVPREAHNRRLPGRVVPAPGLPMRRPRTRRTPGLTAGDGRRVGDCRRASLDVDGQAHRGVDAAEGLEGAGRGKADGDALVRLLGAGVEIERWDRRCARCGCACRR